MKAYFDTRKVHRNHTICQHKGCETRVYTDRGYCKEHGHFCKCGKCISPAAKLCAKCAQIEIHSRRTDEQRAVVLANLSKAQKLALKHMSHAEELAYVIECYEQALAVGFHPSLCKDALNKLRSA